ncbi:P-loop containing nucleoside triphosphate hydrolase protein [Fomitopsis serialis]|uniref:P-loop containing nucleoside triphosphate hydrolase protein n=1 Tax=Fomitopsis serialis TaxID=139415 RepID=UPI0020089A5F|nr:P-loop containing nucleoside triphosphate hydrolase protein [Neoantrodia serialis]KAH9916183.1 P-loop containing nucleoside triphosphate hydrolase protein [Neoantrodia serialis]
MSQAYFRDLNPAQVQAVQHPPDVPLQILAGPGSGKTRVLTARIAHLIFTTTSRTSYMRVTFTNKAANGCRARLDVLVGSMIAKAKARGQQQTMSSHIPPQQSQGQSKAHTSTTDDDSDGDPDEGENQTLQDANIMAVVADVYTRHNTIQYKLMRRIAAASGCVTIVGDPDQSIYGWRSAEVKNFMKMQRAICCLPRCMIGRLPEDATNLLEQNYRSTASILSASMAIVSQESALQKEGIPNRVLGGHKFFERLEVKDLLAYLQLIDNPHFVPAFARVINVPARGIGEKLPRRLIPLHADNRRDSGYRTALKLSPLEVVMRIYDGTLPDIKPSVKRKLASFVPPVRMLQKLAQAVCHPLTHWYEYEAYLRKMQKDWDSRWENVQELINFASEVETKLGDGIRRDQLDDEGFVEASMLSTDMTADNKDDGKGASNGLSCLFLQALLYLTHANSRMFAGEAKKKDMSDFVSAALWANQLLGRNVPDESDVARRMAQ